VSDVQQMPNNTDQRTFWHGRSVLVTGAGGFTGSALANRLAEMGAKVRAFVRQGGSRRDLNGSIELFEGSITETSDCERALNGIDTVFNVAAVFRQLSGGRAVLHAVHVEATEKLMRAAKSSGARVFVHTSTMGVHGHVISPPGNEESPFSPGDDYQETKLEGELLAKTLAEEIQLPLVVIRPCGIYGPGDTRFLKMIKPIRKKRFLMIGDGSAHYHFVYIDDLVNGFILSAQIEDAVGETFLVGSDKSLALADLAITLAKLQNVTPPRLSIPVRPILKISQIIEKICLTIGIEPFLHPRRVAFFTKNRHFNIEKAKRVMGYEPEVDVEEGFRRTIAWSENEGLL